jgi:hypothetical protein
MLRALRRFSTVSLHFKSASGAVRTVQAEEGATILEVAHKNEIDLEGSRRLRSPDPARGL